MLVPPNPVGPWRDTPEEGDLIREGGVVLPEHKPWPGLPRKVVHQPCNNHQVKPRSLCGRLAVSSPSSISPFGWTFTNSIAFSLPSSTSNSFPFARHSS